MSPKARAVPLLLLLVAGSNCASKTVRPTIEFIQPPSDRAYVYVLRPDVINRHRLNLWLDGERAGKIGPGNFAFYQVRPGRHVLNVGLEEDAEYRFRVQGGAVIYLRLTVATVPTIIPGLVDGETWGEFRKVSREEGRAGVRECTIILDPPPPLPPSSQSGE
jgi:hypothetical protein